VALVGIAASAQQLPSKDARCEILTTERVVAIGDVHGAFDRFVAILQEARLIDARRRWIGGRAMLVQTGDVPDRGADSRPVFDLLRRLEGEASRAGGRVHALLGNHEVMRMRGEFPYVSAGEYAAFSTRDSGDFRERYYALALAELKTRARAAREIVDDAQFRKKFLDEVPLGFVELRRAFLPDGDYGRWLRGHSVMVKINGVAFVHGGTTPAAAAAGCAGINAAARAELGQATPTDRDTPTFLTDIQGPLWFRGLVDDPATVTAGDVDAILRSLDARAIVVGHTVQQTVDDRGLRHAVGRIRPLFDGRVFQIDTGMVGGDFFPGGRASALELQGTTITAVYQGSREVLRAPGPGDTPRPPRRAPR
jgi:3',5'-cyclic AMP phosphodiesterase CpdA